MKKYIKTFIIIMLLSITMDDTRRKRKLCKDDANYK